MSEIKPFAFVLMPFDDQFDDIYKLGIKAVARELEIVAERVDEQSFSETILERIYRQIEHADIIIADMTGKNPNVFYEVGYAHALKKPVVLLTQNVEDIPFDLKHHRHLVYENSVSTLREQLKAELFWQKSELKKRKTKTVSVSIKAGLALLFDKEYKQSGSLDLTIDLKNLSEKKSPEIDAIYIHSGEGWSVFHDGKVSPSTNSDIDPFVLKHFIPSPIPRLSPDAWAQLKTNWQKDLWWISEGSEKLDEYHVKGNILVEIATSEGNFKDQFPLDIKFDEIPF